MAYSFNGCGTRFYGQRDIEPNSSYITTEWVVIVFFPIFPIRSLRVCGGNPGTLDLAWSTHYDVYETMWPNWKQVLCVYGFAALCIAWMPGLLWLCLRIADNLQERGYVDAANIVVGALLVGTIWWPLFLPRWIRRYFGKNRIALPI